MEVSLNPGLGISCVHDLVALMTVSGFSAQKILALYLKAFFGAKDMLGGVIKFDIISSSNW
jgi:hypothetical protein